MKSIAKNIYSQLQVAPSHSWLIKKANFEDTWASKTELDPTIEKKNQNLQYMATLDFCN